MSHPLLAAEAIYSTFGTDPDFADLVEMFVEEMPNRVATLVTAYDAADREQLRTTAHQMKGASGSYGFHQLTEFAARLENSLKNEQPETAIKTALDELVAVCQKVRPGAPQ